jgi:hypothetical protein
MNNCAGFKQYWLYMVMVLPRVVLCLFHGQGLFDARHVSGINEKHLGPRLCIVNPGENNDGSLVINTIFLNLTANDLDPVDQGQPKLS